MQRVVRRYKATLGGFVNVSQDWISAEVAIVRLVDYLVVVFYVGNVF